MFDGRLEQARELIDEMLERLRADGQDEKLTDLYLSVFLFLSNAQLFGDQLDEAEATLSRGWELAGQAGNRTLQASMSSGLAQLHVARGNYEAARDWADQSLAISEQIGSTGALRNAATAGLTARLELGEDASISRFVDTIDLTLNSGGDFVANSQTLVELLIRVGDLGRARKYVDRALERNSGRMRLTMSEISEGMLLRALGPAHWDQAAARFASAREHAQEIGISSLEVNALIGAGSLARAHCNAELGSAQLREAAELADGHGLVHLARVARRELEVEAGCPAEAP
jgi:tetratricopeptide (TPR) repeat protein